MSWSLDDQITAVRGKILGQSSTQTADLLGRNKNTLRSWYSKNGVTFETAQKKLDELLEQEKATPAPHEKEPAPDTTIEEDTNVFGNEYWRHAHAKLLKKYKELVKHSTAQTILADRILEAAPQSYQPVKDSVFFKSLFKDEDKGPQSMVLLMSDAHMGKVVKPAHTMGFGEYNFDIFLDRLAYMVRKAAIIRKDHVPTPIDELVIPILGDMAHGYLKKGSEAELPNVVLNVVYEGAHAIAQAIRLLAGTFKQVRVPCVTGNHGRWDSQKRMPSENRHSNFDGFLYMMVESLLRDLDNVFFQFDDQPFQVFDIYKWRFHASHGEHLRGGDKILGLPAHAIGRNVANTSQQFAKVGEQCPHYYLCGHLHREITIPHALGHFIYNGAFVGVDGYGTYNAFTPADASQRLFCVHPRYGKTAEWSLSLEFAEKGEGRDTFKLPNRFDVE